MPSMFTWLDYRSEDREQVMQLINDLRQPEARDELGVGRVRDRLADLLFPGTSTIQTRVRYFLFIPWIYRKLEIWKLSGEKATQEARRLESNLISTMQNKGHLDGLIGRYAGATVKRMAGSVYWNGLYVWGIRRYDESQSEYYARLQGHYSRSKALKSLSSTYHKYDDLQDTADIGNWDVQLPDAPNSFPTSGSDISFDLTYAEARYVRHKLNTTAQTKDSLLAFLVLNQVKIGDDINFAWDLSDETRLKIEQCPPLFSKLIHARNFSLVIHGSRLLYNLMLALKAVDRGFYESTLIERYQTEINTWIDDMYRLKAELTEWFTHLNTDFWQLIGTDNIPNRTKHFIDTWIKWAIDSPERAIEADETKNLIANRERDLKGRKARLHNADALQIWGGESGAYQLDFRWKSPVRGFINEIVTALGDEYAQS